MLFFWFNQLVLSPSLQKSSGEDFSPGVIGSPLPVALCVIDSRRFFVLNVEGLLMDEDLAALPVVFSVAPSSTDCGIRSSRLNFPHGVRSVLCSPTRSLHFPQIDPQLLDMNGRSSVGGPLPNDPRWPETFPFLRPQLRSRVSVRLIHPPLWSAVASTP